MHRRVFAADGRISNKETYTLADARTTATPSAKSEPAASKRAPVRKSAMHSKTKSASSRRQSAAKRTR